MLESYGNPMTVVENVAVETPEDNANPQLSKVPLQTIQSKSLNRARFQ
jgi:hypothetical protein